MFKIQKTLVKLIKKCYTILATQLNIRHSTREVFLFVKNTFSILAFSCSLSKVVSQQLELCVFCALTLVGALFYLEEFSMANEFIDVTGIKLTPGNEGKDCDGNGEHFDEDGYLIECCCDECDFLMMCMEKKNKPE